MLEERVAEDERIVEQTNELLALDSTLVYLQCRIFDPQWQHPSYCLPPVHFPVPTQLCAFLLTDSEAPNVPLHSAASSKKDTSPTTAEISSLKSHLLLDLRNRQPRIQALGACPRAIQNSMTPIQTHTIVQGRLPLLLLFIPAIRQPPITLQ
jgi:hypothetical protein